MLAPLVIAALVAAADAPVAAPDEHPLECAEEALFKLDYRRASVELDRALQRYGNDRDTLLRILELRGLTSAALRDESTATASFRALLALSPDHQLASHHAPRIRALYESARADVVAQGALDAILLADQGDGFVRVQLEPDPWALAKRVRFHFVREDGDVQLIGGELVNGVAAIEAPRAVQAGWWGEVLGENDAVLFTLGAHDALLPAPRRLFIPTFGVLVPGWAPAAPPQRGIVSRVPKASWGLWAGAGATAMTGAVFAVLSESAKRSVLSAQRDDAGRVVGMTQREAFGIDQRARATAQVANIAFAATLTLGAAGGAYWWWTEQMPVGAAR